MNEILKNGVILQRRRSEAQLFMKLSLLESADQAGLIIWVASGVVRAANYMEKL